MFSSLSKVIHYPRLPLSLVKQQYLFASKSSSKIDSTGDTHEGGKKDIHEPQIDVSQTSGPKNEKERTKWQQEEQGFTSNTQTRQERIPVNEKTNVKTKTSKK